MLSVIVIAKNEEARIKACLESIRWADEIIVANNNSTDNTVKIAKQYTDKVYDFKTDDFSQLRNQALEKSKGDWILYVDADERVLTPLQQEISLIISNKDGKDAYAISRKNIIFGQEVDYGPYKTDWIIRLFKKSSFKKWIGEVHEHAIFEGDLGYSKNSLLHLTHRDLDHFMYKSLEWSKIDAKLKIEAKHPLMTKWRFIRIFITELFNQLISRKGLFGGTVGIIDSMLQVFSTYFSYIRLWEDQQKQPLKEVYDEIDKKLIENNFNYP